MSDEVELREALWVLCESWKVIVEVAGGGSPPES